MKEVSPKGGKGIEGVYRVCKKQNIVLKTFRLFFLSMSVTYILCLSGQQFAFFLLSLSLSLSHSLILSFSNFLFVSPSVPGSASDKNLQIFSPLETGEDAVQEDRAYCGDFIGCHSPGVFIYS